MSLIRRDELFAQLNAQKHLPYAHIPENRQTVLTDVLRVFEMMPQDALSLMVADHPTYVSVLAGIVEVVGGECGALTLRRGETRLVAPRDATLAVSTQGGALLCIADSESIDDLLSFESLIDAASAGDRVSWEALERARRSPSFRRVPLECVEEAFRRMGRQTARAGTEVIRQGEQGDLFYVVTTGKGEVWQTGLYDEVPQKVADLGPGDVFGEEALVTGGTRSATVRITADAELLTLGKDDYQALISQQLVDEIEPAVAQTMRAAGYRLLDVRYAEEHEDACIPTSLLVPLPDLRARTGELDPAARWIVYCRSGKRSAVAALLLRQRGFQALSLRGGMAVWPYETVAGSPGS
jgi:rhodanese-related sulfurtransferase